ncbi:NAD(P)/FAD-dependent oxidoreductase [Paenibacillus sp. PR3]|uniref:NAD(P)/FAD-dependent oxidoreductase n=1 Tax=Paenibacillus terricola TaxID=2763503 RepID=A0ABR8N473_9BACL|nr:NAD(P)/FAD-dependent oxidoreductase [Paenibacillus terricola]MBD3922207.1 NAD(P)/FAD-dependent oxidoreductase [Paenibacillus terricola]
MEGKLNETYDAIIIGSGLAGLTAAALLAQDGAKVLVLEQHYIVGGCASTFRRGKFLFDAAVHLIGGCEQGGEIYSIYEKLGLLDQIGFIESKPMCHISLGQSQYEIPANLYQLSSNMENWFPEDKQAIRETMEEIIQLGGAILRGDYEDDEQITQRVLELKNVSFAEYLNNRFSHPHASMVLGSLHPYIGVPTKQLSVLYMMSTMASYHGGAYYTRGSSQKLADVLKDYIQSQNGVVRIKRRVEKIICSEGKVQGVIDHKGNQYNSSIIISNADLKTTLFKLLGEEYLPPSYNKRINRMVPSYSAVILYAAIQNDGALIDFPHEQFILPDNELDSEQKYLFDPLNNETDPGISVCCPSTLDSGLAPEGYSVLSFMAMCDAAVVERVREEKGKSFVHEKFLDLLENKLPGIRKRLVIQEFATPRTIERYTSNHNGSIYGWMKSADQRWTSDIGPRTPVQGLYLAGHWTRNAHGVYGVMKSGKTTANHIIKQNINNNHQLQLQ